MEMLQGVWKQHLRPRAVVGYGVKELQITSPDHLACARANAFLWNGICAKNKKKKKEKSVKRFF